MYYDENMYSPIYLYFLFHKIVQRVGDEENDEAEAMIRAITHGEIDNAVYSKMADDLESAAQIKRKADKPKKKKKKKTNAASNSSASELATSASEVSVK